MLTIKVVDLKQILRKNFICELYFETDLECEIFYHNLNRIISSLKIRDIVLNDDVLYSNGMINGILLNSNKLSIAYKIKIYKIGMTCISHTLKHNRCKNKAIKDSCLCKIHSKIEYECCSICTEKINNQNVYITPCSHTYCIVCISKWFTISRACPICRKHIHITSLI